MRRLAVLFLTALCLGPGPADTAKKPAAAVPATLRVAAVQMRSLRDLDANVKQTIALLERCAALKVEVAVFPECSVSGYFNDYTPKLTAKQLQGAETKLCAACKKIGIWAVVGMPVRDGKKLYNSAVVIDAAGKVRERYHKVQLAENWPDGGDHLSVFRVKGVPCSIIICHDERYPELVRLPVLAGARVIFYLSHESPLAQEHKLGPYRAQIQARAVENTVWVVHANAPANRDASGSHGQSRIIDPDGTIVHEATLFKEEILTHTLVVRRATAAMAVNSLRRGPLTKWWAAGVKQVRQID